MKKSILVLLLLVINYSAYAGIIPIFIPINSSSEPPPPNVYLAMYIVGNIILVIWFTIRYVIYNRYETFRNGSLLKRFWYCYDTPCKYNNGEFWNMDVPNFSMMFLLVVNGLALFINLIDLVRGLL